MSAIDPYSMTDKLDSTAIGAVTARLEARGEQPSFQETHTEYLDALISADVQRVLEIGCGTGVVARALAARSDFSGRIDASDLSADLVNAARKGAESDGVAERINFSTANVLEMEAENAYDLAIAHTVISHVPDYEGVLAALARSIRNDGRVVIFDGDYASITFGSEDPDDGDALANAIIGGLITNPKIMRQLPFLARKVGLAVERTFSYLISEIGSASFFADMFPSVPVLLPRAGLADEAQATAWIDQQKRHVADGTFFGAINFYTYILKRA